jgi:hypothetical protein
MYFLKRAGGWLLLVTVSCVLAYAFVVHRMWKQQELELDSMHDELATLRAEIRANLMSQPLHVDAALQPEEGVVVPSETSSETEMMTESVNELVEPEIVADESHATQQPQSTPEKRGRKKSAKTT